VLRSLERQFVSGIEHFGGVYVHGDAEIREQLTRVSIAIRRDVLSRLRSAFSVDIQVDYGAFLSKLTECEDLATSCLLRYAQRLSEAATKNNKQPIPTLSSLIPLDLAPETLVNSNDWSGYGSGSPIHFDSLSNIRYSQPAEGKDSTTAPMMPTRVKEAEHGRLSDIDMDRFSAASTTSSEMSGFASLRSLALRIKRGGSPEARNSTDEVPSSVMKWDRSSGSLHLFGRLSATLSVASSRQTDSSRMSWRPEIPATMEENDGNHHAQILPRSRRSRTSEANSRSVVVRGALYYY
jgi:hypothetical protein